MFTRSRKGFELTEAGEALMPLAEEAEKTFAAAKQRVQGLDRTEAGTIKFSISSAFAFDIFAPILARFSVKYPAIDVQVQITSQIADIQRAETDVSLRAAPQISDDVIARKLYEFDVGTYASKSYLKTHYADAGPGGEGLNWIGWTGPGSDPSWLAKSQFPNATVRQSANDGHMHIHLVRQNCGMAKIPVITEHLFDDLERVPGTKPETGSTLWLLLHSDLRRTLRVRRFVDFLADELMALRSQMQDRDRS